jgi:hypothetical protein
MPTTLTLDDDLASQLEEEARRSGRPFKEVVQGLLRNRIGHERKVESAPFVVSARALELQPGIDLSNVGALLEQLEGPTHR